MRDSGRRKKIEKWRFLTCFFSSSRSDCVDWKQRRKRDFSLTLSLQFLGCNYIYIYLCIIDNCDFKLNEVKMLRNRTYVYVVEAVTKKKRRDFSFSLSLSRPNAFTWLLFCLWMLGQDSPPQEVLKDCLCAWRCWQNTARCIMPRWGNFLNLRSSEKYSPKIFTRHSEEAESRFAGYYQLEISFFFFF